MGQQIRKRPFPVSQGTSLGHEQPPTNRHLHPVALSGLRQKWKGRLWLWPWTDSLFPSAGGTGWFRSALHTLKVITILPLWLSHLGLWNQQLFQPCLGSPPRDLVELVRAKQRQQHCPSSHKLWHLYQLSLKKKNPSAVWPCECSGLDNSHQVRAASLQMLQFTLSFWLILPWFSVP